LKVEYEGSALTRKFKGKKLEKQYDEFRMKDEDSVGEKDVGL
jgi:hypothetical protein